MSQEQLVNLGFTYKTGLNVSWASNKTVNVAAGQCRDMTNAFDIVIPSNGQTAPLTASLLFNGANGLDTGTVAANTLYYLYVIFDQTYKNVPALLFSLSATAPLMPSLNGRTYGSFRLIDSVYTNSSSNILLFYNTAANNGVYKQYDTPISVLSSGTATTFTAINLSTAVPAAIFGAVKFQSIFTPNTAGHAVTFQPTGGTGTSYTIDGVVATVSQTDSFELLPLLVSGNPEISYAVSNSSDSISLSVQGYTFNV